VGRGRRRPRLLGFRGADADATAELADRAARGELTLRVAKTLPLERLRDAYTRLERAGPHGKIVLTP
jgi:NADPH:quinone reductase-like Zn-dependent oxidoreductase